MPEDKEITEKDFPLMGANEEELKAKFSAEDGMKLLIDEMEFNKELQLFVINQQKTRKLTTNYIVGCLNKLAWMTMQDDFRVQINQIAKLHKGGR